MTALKNKVSGVINEAANPLATVLGHQDDRWVQKLNNPLQQVTPLLGDMAKGSKQMVNSFASLWKKDGGDALNVGNNYSTPTPATPPVVPMPDQEAIDAAARRARQRQLGRTGFASTILSAASGSQQPTSDRLGP